MADTGTGLLETYARLIVRLRRRCGWISVVQVQEGPSEGPGRFTAVHVVTPHTSHLVDHRSSIVAGDRVTTMPNR